MSSADVIILQAAVENLALFGETATYTKAGTEGTVSVKVWLESALKLQVDGYEAEVYANEKTIEGVISHLGKIPVRGETFTIGSTIYTVRSVLENDSIFVKVIVS